MIRADLTPTGLGPAFRTASTAAELRAGGASQGEPFGDFSGFAAEGGGGAAPVGLGRERASIDAGHAARTVAAFLLEG